MQLVSNLIVRPNLISVFTSVWTLKTWNQSFKVKLNISRVASPAFPKSLKQRRWVHQTQAENHRISVVHLEDAMLWVFCIWSVREAPVTRTFLLQNMKNEEMSTVVVMNLVSMFMEIEIWVLWVHFKPSQPTMDLSAGLRDESLLYYNTKLHEELLVFINTQYSKRIPSYYFTLFWPTHAWLQLCWK